MTLKNSIMAALAATALTLSISGAQAQYFIAPPAFSGSVTTLPYGGYYGPAIAPTPTITYGAPYYFQNFGYDLSNYGYGADYPGNGYYGPGGFNAIGDVHGPAPGRTVNDTIVQGGIVDPTKPAEVLPPDEEMTDDNAADVPQTGAQYHRSAAASSASLISVRRGPYNRVAIAYKGNTNGIADITTQLLDSRKHVVQEAVITSPPAQTLLRRPVTARYYRVIIDYNNGAERVVTRPLSFR
jgi:hypothetical protein